MACLRAVKEAWQGSMKVQGEAITLAMEMLAQDFVHKAMTGVCSAVYVSLQFTQARPGFLQAKLAVERGHVNKFMTVHGGVILTLTDSMASLALTTSGLPPPTGVSTNIQTEFLRPAGKEGGEFVIEAEVVKLGKLLATTRINFYDSDDVLKRKLLAFGSHTKAVNKAWEACGGKMIKYSEDGESVIE